MFLYINSVQIIFLIKMYLETIFLDHVSKTYGKKIPAIQFIKQKLEHNEQ